MHQNQHTYPSFREPLEIPDGRAVHFTARRAFGFLNRAGYRYRCSDVSHAVAAAAV